MKKIHGGGDGVMVKMVGGRRIGRNDSGGWVIVIMKETI